MKMSLSLFTAQQRVQAALLRCTINKMPMLTIAFVLLSLPLFLCETEPADECWLGQKRKIENGFLHSFEKRTSDQLAYERTLRSANASADDKDKALRQRLSLKLAESIGRLNFRGVLDALEDKCRERERRLADPCTTVRYDPRTESCVKHTDETPHCLAMRNYKPGWSLQP